MKPHYDADMIQHEEGWAGCGCEACTALGLRWMGWTLVIGAVIGVLSSLVFRALWGPLW